MLRLLSRAHAWCWYAVEGGLSRHMLSMRYMQGIGRATALLFAKKGFNVVVAARDLTKLQYVAHDCAQAAGRQGASLAVQCDVTSERDVKDLATAVLSKYENVDVVSAE